MAEDGPAGYYVGRPMNHDAQKTQPPPSSQATDDQVNVQVPGYYAGRVQGKKPAAAAAGEQTSAAAAQPPSKESGFFANCFGCFSGGQTAA